MKSVIRNVLFSYLVLLFINQYFTGIRYGGDSAKTLFLVSLGLGLVNLMAKPLMRLISLPTEGVGFLILNFLVNLGAFFIFNRFLSGFSITSGSLLRLNIFGFVLNSYDLTVFWSFCLTSVMFCLAFGFLMWLTDGKKK